RGPAWILGLEIRRILHAVYARTHQPVQGRGGGGAGNRLAQLRLHLYRTLHGLAERQPRGLQEELAGKLRGEFARQPAGGARYQRRQRAHAEHHSNGQRVYQLRQAVPTDGVSRQNTWHCRNGGTHPFVPPDREPLRADTSAREVEGYKQKVELSGCSELRKLQPRSRGPHFAPLLHEVGCRRGGIGSSPGRAGVVKPWVKSEKLASPFRDGRVLTHPLKARTTQATTTLELLWNSDRRNWMGEC